MSTKKRMLICGGAGFIGYNMAKYFTKTYNVYVTTHITPMEKPLNNVTDIQCDLLNNKSIATLLSIVKPHVIIHAAATTSNVVDVINHPYYHVTNNVVMTSLLFRQLHNISTVEHVIFLSCSVMYKSSLEPQSELEWKPTDLNQSYFGGGITKVYIEQLCDFYSRIGKAKYTAIRHPDIYGQHDKTNLNQCHMYSALFNKIMESNDVLDVWGTPATRRDLLYVDDLAHFIRCCIDYQPTKYELYNCGSETLYSIKDIINTIMYTVGKKLKINFQSDKPNVSRTVLLDCTKAYNELEWSPSTSLSTGTFHTYNWFKNKC